jgi:phosphatidylinositol alpha-mannosyltransferase
LVDRSRVKQMRICLVSPYDLSYEGGVNTHIMALASALSEGDRHVRILGPASGSVPLGCDGLPGIIAVPANGSVARVGLLVSARAVARYLAHGCFDIVHVHEPYVPGTARIAVRCATVPVVATFHAYAEHEHLVSRVARQAMAWYLGRLRSAIAASAAAADFARVVYKGPIQIIPNGIDTAIFTPIVPATARPLSLPSLRDVRSAGRPHLDCAYSSAPLRVLFVGRFDEPRKGLAYLLEAIVRLRASGRAVAVQIVGSGSVGKVAELAGRAGAQFLGRLNEAALAASYRDCDVFCAPSIYGESFGLVLIEAMGCGRPVVASDIRGYREAAAGAALLVAPRDPDALAAALLRVADDTTLRKDLIERGFRRAAELDWRRTSQHIVSVYRAAGSTPSHASSSGGMALDSAR